MSQRTEMLMKNTEYVVYCDLNRKPGFQMAMYKSPEGKYYVHTACFRDNGFNIVDVTDPQNSVAKWIEGDWIGEVHDGLCDKKGKVVLFSPGSIVSRTVAGSVNGKLVVDAENSLYVGLYPDAATLTFKDGALTSIEGDGIAAELMRKFMNGLEVNNQTNNMPEFGMGFNKKARLNGNFSEGEMIYGCVHIGVGGDIQHHTDTIVPEATCEIDGELVLKDGKYL